MDKEDSLSDEKVRNMLVKAGFDATLNDDVASFARFMRFMFAEYEARTRLKDTKRTFLIAVSTAMVVAAIPIILKLLKVM